MLAGKVAVGSGPGRYSVASGISLHVGRLCLYHQRSLVPDLGCSGEVQYIPLAVEPCAFHMYMRSKLCCTSDQGASGFSLDDPAICVSVVRRFFIFVAYLFLLHQMGTALFRLMGALGE
jgi:hypothetical protein